MSILRPVLRPVLGPVVRGVLGWARGGRLVRPGDYLTDENHNYLTDELGNRLTG